MAKREKKTQKELPAYLFPKDLNGVKIFVTKCFAAYGFQGKKISFKCNPFLFVNNLSFCENEGKVVVEFDVDYDNEVNLVSRHMSAEYTLKNYKSVVSDIKNMIASAEKLSKIVFIGEKFNETMFNRLRLNLSGWNLIR